MQQRTIVFILKQNLVLSSHKVLYRVNNRLI